MPKKGECIHKLKECALCKVFIKPRKDVSKKRWIPRRAPLKPKSKRQEKSDALHRLLKAACLKRDHYRCVRCARQYHPYSTDPRDILDVSHIFPKSTCPLLRFYLPNVKMLCRECHTWWHGPNKEEAEAWIQSYLGQRAYVQLLTAVLHPDPMFNDLKKVEAYLKQQIRTYE